MPDYGHDLASIHDAGFGEFARSAAPGLLEELRRAGINSGFVVDLGCGSGIWAQELLSAGYDVLGIDRSAAMLKIARSRAPQAGFRKASIYSTKLPRCSAITALGEVLSYRTRGSSSSESVSDLFPRVFEALQPGGLFLFDIATLERAHGPAKRHFSGEDWALMTDYSLSAGGTVLTRKITTFLRAGTNYKRTAETHELRLYKAGEIAEALRAAGFRVRVRRSYGGLPFPRGLRAFLARKSG